MSGNNNTLWVVNILIKELQIPVTRQSIVDEFQKHSEPNSLLAISETLDHWKIPNAAYSVTTDELIETEIPLPFIACFPKGEFVLVNKINKEQVSVSNNHWKNHRLSFEEFSNYYKGTILAFQKDLMSGETDYPRKRRKEIIEGYRIPFYIISLLFITIILLHLNPMYLTTINWNTKLLIFFKTAGLITSILLLLQSVDSSNPLIQKICGSDANKNCNAILLSDAAKATDELSWSEIGFFYYGGTWLALLFNNSHNDLMTLLLILNLLSLPYTFYSIYYQWRIAKQWCIFCCAVQVLLWLEFFALLPYLINGLYFPPTRTWLVFSVALLVPILIWVFIKPYLLNFKQLQVLKPELFRYKYNKDIFQNMLLHEVKYSLPSEKNTIVFGNTAASKVVTLVSNPFCGHCLKAHQILDELLDLRDDVKLQLVFISRQYNRELDQKVIGHFMALRSNNEKNLKKAISDWYKQEKKIFESWSKGYPVADPDGKHDVISEQQEWSRIANINSTPTILINGQKLPSGYRLEDIKHVL